MRHEYCFVDSADNLHDKAYELLGQLLFNEYGIINPSYNRTSTGKPYLSNYPHIKISLSHCNGMVACCVGEREMGIDIEKIHRFPSRVAERVLSIVEMSDLKSLNQLHQQNELFFKLWTLKESYIKAIGQGLSFGMRNVAFKIDLNTISCNIENVEFLQYTLKENYILSICILGI